MAQVTIETIKNGPYIVTGEVELIDSDGNKFPVEKSRAISEMVAAPVRGKFQNADAGRARPERLPTRCERRFSAFHHAANAKGAVEDVVFPRRRPLGAQTAEQPALVQNSE